MREVRLGDIISIADVERCEDNSYPTLSITMRDGIVLQSERFKKNIASVDKRNYKVVRYGQLVVGFPIDEGVIYAQTIVDVGIMSPAYQVWNIDYTQVLSSYLEYYLHGPYAMKYYTAHLRGTTARRRSLPTHIFLDLPVRLPDLEEQDRIVKVMNLAKRNFELYEQQLQKLDELVKARFVELFGDIDENVPLSYYIMGLNAGKSLAGEDPCPNKVLKTSAVTYDNFDRKQVKNLPLGYKPLEEHRVRKGDVIISRMNTIELVGAAAYVWDVSMNTYLPDRLWRAEVKGNACPIFVWQLLIQSSTKESIRRIASGTSGSMKNISKAGLLGIQVKKVDQTIQKQFSAFVEQVYKTKLTIQKSLDKMEVLQKALMQKYFG